MRSIAIATVAIAMASAAGIATAGPPPPLLGCCACIQVDEAQTAGRINQNGTSAVFCTQASSDQIDGLVEQCQLSGLDHKVKCVPSQPGSTCSAELAAEGILCPNAGVPAADGSALAALAVALVAAGTMVLRHRRSRRA